MKMYPCFTWMAILLISAAPSFAGSFRGRPGGGAPAHVSASSAMHGSPSFSGAARFNSFGGARFNNYGPARFNNYSAARFSNYNVTRFNNYNVSRYRAMNTARFNNVNTARLAGVNSSRFNNFASTRFNATRNSQFNNFGSARFAGNNNTRFNGSNANRFNHFGNGNSNQFHNSAWNHAYSNWCHHHHHHYNDFVFIDFGYPFWAWDWTYPYDYFGYGYGYGYDGYPNSNTYVDYTDNGYAGSGAPGEYGDSTVTEVQRQLAQQGYYQGAIDGVLGSRTRYAIRAFKRAHGLPADSNIDNDLLQSLGLTASNGPIDQGY